MKPSTPRALVLVLVLGAAACGSGDGETATAPTALDAAETTLTDAATDVTGTETTAAGTNGTDATAAPTTAADEPSDGITAAGDTTPLVVAAAEAFLATLSSDEAAAVQFADLAKRSDWSNLPDGLYERDGLRLADLTADQQAAAWAVLDAILSDEGYRTILETTQADGALAVADAGMAAQLDFGALNYHVRILGEPSLTEPWMFQFGGHHLGLNATIVADRITLGPTLYGAQPTEFELDGATVRPMDAETDLAYQLVDMLTAEQQAVAVQDGTMAELLLGPGTDGTTIEQEGITGAELDAEQRAAMLALAAAWIGNLNEEDAAIELAAVEATLAETSFLWIGPTTLGEPAYFRLHGPEIYVEFAHQQGQGANAGGWDHIHSMYRDPGNDYGAAFTAG